MTLEGFVPEQTRRADLWELVAVRLRRAIITGELAPAVHLNEPSPARRFDVAAQRGVLAQLVDHAIPRRVGHARHGVEMAWTPLGDALREAAVSALGARAA